MGTGYNKQIDINAKGFIAVTDSVYLLKNLEFDAIFVDEAHHPLPTGMPKCKDLYQLSATHKDEPDFRYTLGQAIEDGIVSDYDITVPVISKHHAYVCLADLLLKQAGRFRRVLAYCNTVAEAKRFQMVLEKLGLAAWHINATTKPTIRQAVMAEFAGELQKPVHVLVTVEVLGEGINIPNADTCMFVEPRQSYRSIVQAIGRVLRWKTIAHIVLPAVVLPNVKSAEGSSEQGGAGHDAASDQDDVSLSSVPVRRSGMKSLGHYASPLAPPNDTSYMFDSLSRQLVEKEAASGLWPSQSRHGNRKVPEKPYFWRGFVHDSQQRAVSSLRPHVSSGGKASQEKHGELPGNWNSVASVDSLQLNSRGKPATVRRAASGKAQLPDELPDGLSQAGSGNIISRRGVSTSQNAVTVSDPGAGTAWPEGSHSRYLEANLLDGIRHNGRTKTTRPEVSEQPNLASTERDSVDEEARHSDGFANRSPSPKGNTKQTLPSPATEAQPHWMTRVALGRKKQKRLTFGRSDGFEAFDKKYEDQLGRFLGALVQADHRLIGADDGHRIQIVDCSLGLEGELGVGEFIAYVHARLDTVLSQRDPWETRFRELEAFAEKNGKLPRLHGAGCDRAETVLSIWLKNQNKRRTLQQLPAHQLQRLLNSTSPLICRRVEGWITSDTDYRFKQNCRELKEYIEMNAQLPRYTRAEPDSSCSRLATWLSDVRKNGVHTMPERRKMLEEVHPLVKELLQKWDDRPLKIDLARWEKQLEKVLHIVKHGRLPKRLLERAEYEWLRIQLRRLDCLPPELAKRLRGSHPLIAAEAARTSGGRNKKGRCHSQGGWLPVQRVDTSASNIRISVKFVLCEMCEVILALGSKEGQGKVLMFVSDAVSKACERLSFC